MASFRRPRGTVVRHIPDWKVGQLHALNNTTTGGGAGTNNGFGLVNDAGQGQALVVWHLEAFARLVAAPTTIQLLTLYLYTGAPLAVTIPGQPLDTNQAFQGGSCWNIPQAANPPNSSLLPFLDVPMSPTGWRWEHDWPICVVRPGISLLAYMFGPVQDVDVSFVWEVTDAL
jgi:hypothetical protein